MHFVAALDRQPDIDVAQGHGDAAAEQLPGGGIVSPLLGVALAGVERGARMLRVHDVFETVQALRLWRAIS
jgi:dihydropteroate synthase